MIFRSVHVRAFGGLTDKRLEFRSGLNVVLGDNESGKSTLFKAIEHTLLTPAALDKRSLLRDLGPFLPLPQGNAAESSITLEVDGAVTIRRRWGAEPADEVRLQNGAVVHGKETAGVIEGLLPVSPATIRNIMFCDQAQLDQTSRLLESHPQVRDEAASALRRARLGAGGVSPDVFLRALRERLAGLLGRWDLSRNRPEKDRSFTDPWSKGAGSIVKAFYEVQENETRLAELTRYESELDRLNADLASLSETRHSVESFLSEHESVFAELVAVRGLDDRIDVAGSRLEVLRAANRRWPVLLSECLDTEESLESLDKTRAELESRRSAAEERARIAAAAEKLQRADRLFEELDSARRALDELSPVDQDLLEALRAIEKDLPFAEGRLASGNLRARVTARVPTEISAGADGNKPMVTRIVPDEPVDLTASRRLVVESADMRLEVETGDEPFEQLSSGVEALRSRQTSLQLDLGVKTVLEAEDRRLKRSAAEKDLRRVQQEICSELSAESLEHASEKRAELQERAGAGPAETDMSGDADAVTTAELAARLGSVREQIGETTVRLRHARQELESLEEKHKSQDELERLLTQARSQLDELTALRATGATVPAGFGSAEEFLSGYEDQRATLQDLSGRHQDARVAYAELVGGQPEETAAEVEETLAAATARFERLRREADTLVRVEERANEIVERLDDALYDPFVELVAGYAGNLTGDRYVPVAGEDPMLPGEFRQHADGTSLPYELLSQGTRDSLALSVRLALAVTALQSGSAPLMMDDPLVDMDPKRRKLASSALTEFARKHQVVVLTCHPEHASLFPDAHVITLD